MKVKYNLNVSNSNLRFPVMEIKFYKKTSH
jgi:hypothetical protein